MSGVGAVVSFRGPVEIAAVEAMSTAAAHRGLAATSPSASRQAVLMAQSRHESDQMMFDDGALVVVVDARLDNRAELIGLLGAAVTSDTISDSALIAAAYQRWGTETAARLLGDFAFVVWDEPRRVVYAARDVMGLRPLFLRRAPDQLLLASEVKQILAVPGVPARLHQAAMTAYLAGHAGPPDWTFYEGIEQLPPGHQLLASDRSVSVERFWHHDPDPLLLSDRGAYAERLFELLELSVRARVPNDRWGLLLSGGLDSGSIAVAAGSLRSSGLLDDSLRAFSWSFEELRESDERAVSDPIAQLFGMRVTPVAADGAWPLKGYPEGPSDRDSPFTGSPYQVLHEKTFATAVAEGVEGLLWGASGDLVIGSGENFIFSNSMGASWAELQGWIADRGLRSGILDGMVVPIVSRFWPPSRARWARDPLWRWQRNIRGVARWPTWLSEQAVRSASLDEIVIATIPRAPTGAGAGYRRRYERIFDPWSVPGQVWMNRNHAKAGLGYADPWADRRLVEFALSVPEKVMGRADEYKPLLRDALKDKVPHGLIDAARKTSPSPLFDRGINDRERQAVRTLLADPLLAQFGFVEAELLREREEYLSSTRDVSAELWYALTAETWLRRHWAP